VSRVTATITWGRCRSGRRWFWTAHVLGGDQRLDGRADSLDEANRQGHLAALQLSAGQYANIRVKHDTARQRLREINAAKRKTRTAVTSDTTTAEYLYGTHDIEDERGYLVTKVIPFRITKKTPKRIYYVRREGPCGDIRLGYVDRIELETKGEVRNYAAGGWWAADFHLYAAPPDVERPAPKTPGVKALKAAMAAAHPDRGGTNEAFIRARHAYLAARERAVKTNAQ
jgi:hypothetical protein